jgi:hypothetical protein
MEREIVADSTMMRVVNEFLKYLVPVSFVIVFMVQLKMLSLLRSQLNLIMFYGKQIEEIRKMMGGQQSRRLPEVPADESGLYEVLRE